MEGTKWYTHTKQSKKAAQSLVSCPTNLLTFNNIELYNLVIPNASQIFLGVILNDSSLKNTSQIINFSCPKIIYLHCNGDLQGFQNFVRQPNFAIIRSNEYTSKFVNKVFHWLPVTNLATYQKESTCSTKTDFKWSRLFFWGQSRHSARERFMKKGKNFFTFWRLLIAYFLGWSIKLMAKVNKHPEF